MMIMMMKECMYCIMKEKKIHLKDNWGWWFVPPSGLSANVMMFRDGGASRPKTNGFVFTPEDALEGQLLCRSRPTMMMER